MATDTQSRIGAKKFVILHHSACFRDSFHYRILKDGNLEQLVTNELRTQHPNSIAVQLEGDFDQEQTTEAQVNALKSLLLELKMRYPAVEVGAHRQIRGDKRTTCPGKNFPMQAIREWAKTQLLDERDDQIRDIVESQYRP